MTNAKHRSHHDSSLIEMHDAVRNGVTDYHKTSKLTVKQQWWKHAYHSSPSCLRPLQPLDKPLFFPSFHPATNTVTTLLTHKKEPINPPHPAWKKHPAPSQPATGPEHRVRLHPSAECCCAEALPLHFYPYTHTYRQMEHARAYVCRLQSQRQPRIAALFPSRISLPPSLLAASHVDFQPEASSSSSSELCAVAAACSGLPWRSPGCLCSSVDHRDGIVPVRPLSASNRFQLALLSQHKALNCSSA